MRLWILILLLPLTISAQVWPNEVPLTNLTTLRVESDQWKNTHGSQPFGIFLGDSTLSGFGNFQSGAYGEGGPSGNTNSDIRSRILQIAQWCNTTNLAANGRHWGWASPTNVGGILYYDLTTGIGGTDALKYKPDWCAIRCGINDIRPPSSYPFTRIVTNMNTILGLMRSSNCLMIVMNMSPYSDLSNPGTDANVPYINSQYLNWTLTNGGGSVYFDDHLLMSNTDGFLPDLLVYEGEGTHSVHLGTNGYAYLATNFVNFLASISDIIPANKKISWSNVGPTNYPVRSTLFNVKTYGAVGDGVTDDTTAIQNAINATTSNSVTYFPAATYRTTGTLHHKRWTTWRGDGRTLSTILQDHTADVGIDMSAGLGSTWVGITNNSATNGSVSMWLSNAPVGLVNGDIVWVSCTNYGIDVGPVGWDQGFAVYCPYCSIDCNGVESTNLSVAQAVMITNISSQVIGFTPPLRYNFTNGPQIFYQEDDGVFNLGISEGIENLKIARGGTNIPNHLIGMFRTAYSWIYNVEIDQGIGSNRGCIYMTEAYKNSIRKVFFTQTGSTGAANAEGILCFCGVDDNLFENNRFDGVRNPLSYNGPAMGNVFAYNYITNILNSVQNYLQSDFTTHGAHPMFNLIEGNILHRAMDDNIHGSSGYQTFFRNLVKGRQENIGGVSNYNGQGCFWIDATNHFNNYAGNVLGYTNILKDILAFTNDVFSSSSVSFSPPNYTLWIWRWGGAGYTNWSSLADHGTMPFELDYTGTTLRTANSDFFNNGGLGLTNYYTNSFVRVVTNSLYLASKPGWFSTLTWPPFGPDTVNTANINLSSATNLPSGQYNAIWPDDTNAPVIGQVMVLQGTLKGGKAGAL